MKKLLCVLLAVMSLGVCPLYGVNKKKNQGKVENLSARLTEAQADRKEAEKKVSDLQKQYDLIKEVSVQEKVALSKKLEAAQKDCAIKTNKESTLSAELLTLKNMNVKLHLEKNDLEREKKRIEEEKQVQENRAKFFAGKLKNKTQSNKEKEKINQLQKKVKELEKSLKEEQKKSLKNATNHQQAIENLKNIRKELQTKQQENNQSVRQLNDKEKHNKKLQDQIIAVEKQIDLAEAAKEKEAADKKRLEELANQLALEKEKVEEQNQEELSVLDQKLKVLKLQNFLEMQRNQALGKRTVKLFKENFTKALTGDLIAARSVQEHCFAVKDFSVADTKALYQLVQDIIGIGINAMKVEEQPGLFSSLVGLPTFVAKINAYVSTIREKMANIDGALQKYEQPSSTIDEKSTDQDSYIRSCYAAIKTTLQSIEDESKRSSGIAAKLRSKTFQIGSFKNPVRSSAKATRELVETFLNPTFGVTSVYQGTAIFNEDNSAFDF